MKGHKSNLKKNNIIKLCVVAGSLVLIAAFAYDSIKTFSQISPAKAQKACESLFQDAKSQITAVPGYTIVNEGKSCDVEKDEVGSTDYLLSALFLVSKNPADNSDATKNSSNSVSEIKSNINYLTTKLPRKDHWLWVETRKDYTLRVVNESPLNGQPETYCITTNRYLDHSGRYIEQDPSHNRGGYLEPGSIPGYDPCASLDK